MTDARAPNPAAEQLLAIVQGLQALEEERDAINAEMRLKRKQAKGQGFDLPTLAQLLRRRKKAPAELIEADALLETYEAALGCGAAAAGALSMKKNEEGFFEVEMVTAGPHAGEKLSKSMKARRDAVTLAELARQAREG